MPIPPRVSVVALRTADLARSTGFYVALGWELSTASTATMSLFKTAGSYLLICTDELVAELGGQEVAAALAGEPTGEAILSIHGPATPRSPPRSRRRSEPVGCWSRGPLPRRWAGPMRSSPIRTATFGRLSTIRCTGWGRWAARGPLGRSRSPTSGPDGVLITFDQRWAMARR
jgi:catechol 2,3-dioxygenase-like lactoylglutathione lyase family enzyme